MIDDLTRSILEQRDNIENQRNRELNSNIKHLQQENQELKEMHKTMARYALDIEAKIDLYKSVLDETRKYIEELYDNTDDIICYDIDKYRKEFLLQILDKAKGE